MPIAPIAPISVPAAPTLAPTQGAGVGPAAAGATGATPSFGDVASAALEQVAGTQAAAAQMSQAAATGAVDPTRLMVTLTEAELTLQVTSAVRDRAVEAFNEVMRMQV